jgi:peroxiredoxin
MRIRLLTLPTLIALIGLAGLIAGTVVAQDFPAVPPVGSKMPGLTLATLSGEATTLAANTGKNGILVIFISVQCPVSNAYNERMEALAQQWNARGFNVVGVNANRTESPDAITAHAREHGFTFTILKDNDNKLADALGASFTPETYLFDSSGTLRYHGRIDDSKDASAISKRDLTDALSALSSGKAIAVTDTKAFGCTIKRVPRS